MRSALVIFSLLVVAVVNGCFTTLGGHAYDFSSLQASSYYAFSGAVARHDHFHRGHHGEKYVYFVNFCKEVDRKAMNESSCDEKPNSAAFQVAKASRYHPPVCFALGTSSRTTFELIDSSNPSLGVRANYAGGEECLKRIESVNATGHTSIEWEKVERTFHLEFVCEPGYGLEASHYVNMPLDKGTTVTEEEQCEYTLRFYTHLACLEPHVSSGIVLKGGGGVFQAIWTLLYWVWLALVFYTVFACALNYRRLLIGFAQIRTSNNATTWYNIFSDVFSPTKALQKIKSRSNGRDDRTTVEETPGV